METINTDAKDIEDKIKDILSFIGEDPEREGIKKTPSRMVSSWRKLFGGYERNPEKLLTTFKEGACDEMVVLKDIEFYSTCEHHFLPFFGKIHIGYLPKGKVIGISKLARLVEVFSRRLQIQEKLVAQIADSIEKYLVPLGVMITAEAQHLCMISRGVEKQNSVMVTSAIRGNFKKKEVRNEFLELIK